MDKHEQPEQRSRWACTPSADLVSAFIVHRRGTDGLISLVFAGTKSGACLAITLSLDRARLLRSMLDDVIFAAVRAADAKPDVQGDLT